MPLISVIVPTFNNITFIGETLLSIAGQRLERSGYEIEVIVVDDGSTDATAECVEQLRTQLNATIKIIRQNNGGVCRARNAGFQASKGCLIAWCDHDDIWHPEKLRLQLDILRSSAEVGMVNSQYLRWFANQEGDFSSPARWLNQFVTPARDARYCGWTYPELLYDIYILTSTSLMRRTLAEQTGPWNEALPYAEDWDYWLRASRFAPFVQLKSPLVLYRQHKFNGSRMCRPHNWANDVFDDALANWGYLAPNGAAADEKRVKRTQARNWYYHGEANLLGGHVAIARSSLRHAWRLHPSKMRYIISLLRSYLAPL